VPETNQTAARFVYVLLHGSGSKTDTWFGDIQAWRPLNPADPLTQYITVDHGYSEGITVASAGAPGAIVNIGACFGAYTLDSPYGNTHKTPENSLALKYLASGSRAFIADTHISISTNSEPGGLIRARTGFEILLWQEIRAGATPIDAFLRAKQLMAGLITAQYADGDGDGFADDPLEGDLNYLTIHEMVYLGRP
jgi:hypothetical protein